MASISKLLASTIHAARVAGPFDTSAKGVEVSLQGAKAKLMEAIGDLYKDNNLLTERVQELEKQQMKFSDGWKYATQMDKRRSEAEKEVKDLKDSLTKAQDTAGMAEMCKDDVVKSIETVEQQRNEALHALARQTQKRGEAEDIASKAIEAYDDLMSDYMKIMQRNIVLLADIAKLQEALSKYQEAEHEIIPA